MIIRSVLKNEYKFLSSFGRETFLEAFGPNNTRENINQYLANAFNESRIQEELSNPNSFFFFIEENSNVLGYLKLNCSTAQTETFIDNAIEIERIYILKEMQNRKLGRKLIEYAESFALQKAIDTIWLGVWGKNIRAIRFYKKNGFQEFARHSFILGTDKQTDIMLKKKLN